MTHPLQIIYVRQDSGSDNCLNDLCAVSGLKTVALEEKDPSLNCFLEWDKGLLLHTGIKGQKPLHYDFDDQLRQHRNKNYALSKEPLYKALGLKKGEKSCVLDTTCGTGKDTLLMFHFGAKVKARERVPVVYALLWDALRRSSITSEEIQLKLGAATIEDDVDVIFFDPMYAQKNKKALSRKEMQVFEELVGNDEDQDELLEQFINSGKRVVFKRPLNAPATNCDHSYKGKSTRYDVWFSK